MSREYGMAGSTPGLTGGMPAFLELPLGSSSFGNLLHEVEYDELRSMTLSGFELPGRS